MVAGAAVGQYQDSTEDLQPAQQGENTDNRSDGGQVRPGNVAEPGPGRGPVQFGRFVIFLRNILQAGQEKEKAEAPVVPDKDRCHRPDCGVRFVEPVVLQGVQTDCPQETVENTDPRVEQPGEHHPNHYDGEDPGHVVDGAEESRKAFGLIDRHRHSKGDGTPNNQADRPEDDGVKHRTPEDVILENPQVVIKADEGGIGANPVPTLEAQYNPLYERDKGEYSDEDQGREQKEVSFQTPPPVTGFGSKGSRFCLAGDWGASHH